MRLETFFDPRVSEWVSERLGYKRGFGNCHALGVLRGESLIAGVVYHDWSPENETVQLSAAADDRRWLSRQVVRDVLGYPFSFAQTSFIQTDMENPARAIFRKLGATEHVIPRLLGRTKDGVICALTDDAWKASKYGKANG